MIWNDYHTPDLKFSWMKHGIVLISAWKTYPEVWVECAGGVSTKWTLGKAHVGVFIQGWGEWPFWLTDLGCCQHFALGVFLSLDWALGLSFFYLTPHKEATSGSKKKQAHTQSTVKRTSVLVYFSIFPSSHVSDVVYVYSSYILSVITMLK